MKATRPSPMIMMVFTLRKLSASIVRPVPVAKKIVTMLMRAFCAVSDRRSVTPDSRKRFPSISIPTREATGGRRSEITIVQTTGNTMRSNFVTGRSWGIRTSRSFCVVKSVITGG